MNETLIVQTIASVLAASVPLIYAGIGETLTEKVGVTNLSLDGTILLSAMVGFAAAYTTGSVLAGILAAMAIGALLALLVAYGSIALKQDQVAVGFVLTLLAADLSSFLGKPFVRIPGPRVPHLPIPFLADIPVVGPILFRHNILVYLAYLLVIGAWVWISRTQPGLRLRAVGESPETADAMGISVTGYRYVHTVLGGALAGIGGAFYSLAIVPIWVDGMTKGVGWIAIALVILGFWRPGLTLVGAYLFGALQSLGVTLKARNVSVSGDVLDALPFVMTIVVLVLVSSRWAHRRLGAPAALGVPYEREERQ